MDSPPFAHLQSSNFDPNTLGNLLDSFPCRSGVSARTCRAEQGRTDDGADVRWSDVGFRGCLAEVYLEEDLEDKFTGG